MGHWESGTGRTGQGHNAQCENKGFGNWDKTGTGQWNSGQWDNGQVNYGHVDKWRAHLNQTGGLQRLYNVSCGALVDNDLGPGSGWQ
jgi:hypothetical protein